MRHYAFHLGPSTLGVKWISKEIVLCLVQNCVPEQKHQCHHFSFLLVYFIINISNSLI